MKNIFKIKLNSISIIRNADILNKKGILFTIMYKKENEYFYKKDRYAVIDKIKWSAITILKNIIKI